MKLLTESREWRKIAPGIWERTYRCKDKNRKSGSRIVRRVYYEIICKTCGTLGVARKSDIKRSYGQFCSRRCARQGISNPNWQGGRKTHSDGYMLLKKPNHPNADKDGYVREHVFVMSKELGRALRRGEIVHHMNENRRDNRIENLQLTSRSEHNRYRRKLKWVNANA